MNITIGQIKQARTLLAWSQDDIAIACGLDTATIVNFELGRQFLKRQTFEDIRATLEVAGVEFAIAGVPAVKLRKKAKRFRPTRTKPTHADVGVADDGDFGFVGRIVVGRWWLAVGRLGFVWERGG